MKRIKDSTPAKDGFRMPGEFERQEGVYMLWPQRTDNWRNGGKPAQEVFTKVASTIAKYEKMTVLVNREQYANARNMLPDNVRLIEMSNNDSWVRDTGATFVLNKKGQMRGIDWGFNAYGGFYDGIYFPWDFDECIGQKMSEIEGVDYYQIRDFVCEGGSFHVDGEGTCIVTEETLLSPGRNPNLTKKQIEKILKNYLNVQKVLWLPKGLYNDIDTNGHVDNICNFVRPGVVVLAWSDDKKDPQYKISREDYDYLSSVTDAKGRKLEIHKLYCPSPQYITAEESGGIDYVEGTIPRNEGDRMAASYVNYLTGNGFIALPVFNDPMDEKAIELLSKLYPDRKVEPIYAREILLGGGNIHCITQQVPASKK